MFRSILITEIIRPVVAHDLQDDDDFIDDSALLLNDSVKDIFTRTKTPPIKPGVSNDFSITYRAILTPHPL